MSEHIEKLISIGSDAISDSLANLSDFAKLPSPITEGLMYLYGQKNGFFAFYGALHIFPTQSNDHIGLNDWNAPELWINEYKGMISDAFFFAEDIFGGQFCVRSDGVYSFDPETANFEYLSATIEDWAALILKDYNFLTGSSIASAWQTSNGPLSKNTRLMPKTPFLLGGKFDVENLYELDSSQSLKIRANLAVQIKDFPDGANIRWNIIE